MNGKTESEIIYELGDPYMIISQYKSTYNNSNIYNKRYRISSNSVALNIVLLIIIGIVTFPIWSFLFACLLGLYGATLGVIIGGLGFIVAGFTGSLALSIISIPFSIPLSAILLLGVGTTALGILLCVFSIWITKVFYEGCINLFSWIKCRFFV